jgi:hypothetical protein
MTRERMWTLEPSTGSDLGDGDGAEELLMVVLVSSQETV